MKRFGLFLVIVGNLSFVDTTPVVAQLIDAPPAMDAPQAKDSADYHEKMCGRMCGQYGKKKQVCGKNGKTYNNACVAKCAKVSYKGGPCPTPGKPEGEDVAKANTTDTLTDEEYVDKRLVGHVKFFNAEKKYGFISGVDGEEVYLEQAAIAGKYAAAPKQGDRVRFATKPGPQGVHATNVSIISEEEETAEAERRKQVALGLLDEEPTPTPPPKVEIPKAAPNDGIYDIPSR